MTNYRFDKPISSITEQVLESKRKRKSVIRGVWERRSLILKRLQRKRTP